MAMNKSPVFEYSPYDLLYMTPQVPHKTEIEVLDLTSYLFDVRPNEKYKQLVFPDVPRGREQIEVQWIWIFGKPKYGKTTKSLSIINYALKSGKYDLSKTQIMQSEDFVAMMEKIKRGMEVAILLLDDAHKHQSAFMMASTSGREHADMTFLARHIFKSQTGLPYGVLIIIANAQEFRSINKWIRDQAVLVGYSGLIFEDPNIKRMPKKYVDILSDITRHVEEYKEQHYKSRMVVYLPHRDKPDLTIEDYNNPYETPYGVVNLEPLKRICPSCRTIYKSFKIECPVCGTKLEPVFEYRSPKTGKIKLIPKSQILIQVEEKTSTIRDMETLAKREQLVDKLYRFVLNDNIDPMDKEFLNILQYKASREWDLTIEERKMFETNPVYFMRNVRGKYAAEQHIKINEDMDTIEEEIDLSQFKPSISDVENISIRYNPNLINIFNRLVVNGVIKNERHAQMFRLYYFDENGNFLRNPEDRKYDLHALAQKFGIDRSHITKIISTGSKQSIWNKMLYEIGHEYERWVAEHLKYNNALPYIYFDNIKSRTIILGGDTSEPDVVVFGQREGHLAVDIISLKTIFNESAKTYYLNPQSLNQTSQIAPELNAFKSALNKGYFIINTVNQTNNSNQKLKIKVSEDAEISLVVMVRNLYYDNFEVAYRFTSLSEIPATITVSYKKFQKAKETIEEYSKAINKTDIKEIYKEIAGEFTNTAIGVPVYWKPL